MTDATSTPWTAKVLTLFPEMFPGPLGLSLAGKALATDRWRLEATDIRSFTTDKHHTVDDSPFGGGVGLVMKPDVIDAALTATVPAGWPLLYLTPRGKPLVQARVRQLAVGPGAVILCGRYEGVDQRVLDQWAPEEISLGDIVLSGGEPAALCLIDACVRLLPGVMGKEEGHLAESFENGLLEHPCYTRPADWGGRAVPAALLSGHHENIRAWRRAESERATRERRPDLWRRFVEGAGQKIVMEGPGQ